MYKKLSLVVLVVWLGALTLHVLAWLGIDSVFQNPAVWGIHLLALAAFGLSISRWVSDPEIQEARKQKLNPIQFWRVALRGVPWPFVVILFASLLYAVFNFMMFTGAMEGGGPSIRDGQYVLQNHGELIRVITEEEYRAFRTWEVRGFSGHWLLFLWFGFIGLRYR